MLEIRSFEGEVFQFTSRLDKALLDLFRFQITFQLVLEGSEAWNIGVLGIEQLDQVPAKFGAHRLGDFALLEREQCRFEFGGIHTRTGETEVATIGGRAGIFRCLPGQRCEILTLVQPLTERLDARERFVASGLDQDMRCPALLGQIGDFGLVAGLQLFLADVHLIEEAVFLELHVFDHDLFRGHEALGILLIIGGHLLVRNGSAAGIGLDAIQGEIAGLLVQTHEVAHLLFGHEATAGHSGLQLADEHFFFEHLTELQPTIAHLADDLIEAGRAETAVFLEFGGLQNDLIERCLRQGKIGFPGGLHQQATIDQIAERGVAQQVVVDQGGIEIAAKLLCQLPTLHFHGLAQFGKTDFLTIHLGGGLLVTDAVEDGFEAGQRQQYDDETDDGLGNPPL